MDALRIENGGNCVCDEYIIDINKELMEDAMVVDRQIEFDIAKGFAILCVIFGHLGKSMIDTIVFPFHMPLFFLISGYFLSTRRTFYEFVVRKVNGLIVPYFFTGLLIVLLSIPCNLALGHSVYDGVYKWFCGVLYGAGCNQTVLFPDIPSFIGALWFLLALFWASVIVRVVLDYSHGFLSWMFLIVFFFLGWHTSTYVWWPWDLQAGMTAAVFVYIGYYVKCKNYLSRQVSVWHVSFVAVFVLGSMYFYDGLSIVENHYGNGVLDIVRATLITWIILLCCRKIKNHKIGNILRWFGVNSIIVLAFHIIELDLVPWGGVVTMMKHYGMDSMSTWICIIVVKIIWASFGIWLVQHSWLRYIYCRR